MPDLALTARSGYSGLAVPGRHGRASGAPGVTIAERTGLALASLIARRGQAAALSAAVEAAYGTPLPATPRWVAGTGATAGVEIAWAGVEQWLVLAPEGPDLEHELRTHLGGLAAIADQSDGRAILRVAGPRVRDALAKGIPIDLHPRSFRPGDAALTLAGHIGVHLWQVDDATYDLAVFRSFAGSLWSWLTASAAEYGYEVATSTAPVTPTGNSHRPS